MYAGIRTVLHKLIMWALAEVLRVLCEARLFKKICFQYSDALPKEPVFLSNKPA